MIGYWRFPDAILALNTQRSHAILPGLIPPKMEDQWTCQSHDSYVRSLQLQFVLLVTVQGYVIYVYAYVDKQDQGNTIKRQKTQNMLYMHLILYGFVGDLYRIYDFM